MRNRKKKCFCGTLLKPCKAQEPNLIHSVIIFTLPALDSIYTINAKTHSLILPVQSGQDAYLLYHDWLIDILLLNIEKGIC